MKGIVSIIAEKAPSLLKSTTHFFENETITAIAETLSPHEDVQFVKAIVFKKKKHFKDLAPAMKALKEMDVPVKTIAAAAKCSLSTAYKAIKSVSEK